MGFVVVSTKRYTPDGERTDQEYDRIGDLEKGASLYCATQLEDKPPILPFVLSNIVSLNQGKDIYISCSLNYPISGESWHLAALCAANLLPPLTLVSGSLDQNTVISDVIPKAAYAMENNDMIVFLNPAPENMQLLGQSTMRAGRPLLGRGLSTLLHQNPLGFWTTDPDAAMQFCVLSASRQHIAMTEAPREERKREAAREIKTRETREELQSALMDDTLVTFEVQPGGSITIEVGDLLNADIVDFMPSGMRTTQITQAAIDKSMERLLELIGEPDESKRIDKIARKVQAIFNASDEDERQRVLDQGIFVKSYVASSKKDKEKGPASQPKKKKAGASQTAGLSLKERLAQRARNK
jgi:hypothetical protein